MCVGGQLFTDEALADLDRKLGDLTDDRLAKAFGVSKTFVFLRRAELGIDSHRSRRGKDIRKVVFGQRRKGKTLVEIGNGVGLSKQRIHQFLRERRRNVRTR